MAEEILARGDNLPEDPLELQRLISGEAPSDKTLAAVPDDNSTARYLAEREAEKGSEAPAPAPAETAPATAEQPRDERGRFAAKPAEVAPDATDALVARITALEQQLREAHSAPASAPAATPPREPPKVEVEPLFTKEQMEAFKEEYPEAIVTLLTKVNDRVVDLETRHATERATAKAATEEAIQSELEAALPADIKAWRKDRPDLFATAVAIDDVLFKDKAWEGKPPSERFAEAARRTRIAAGLETPAPIVDPQQKAVEDAIAAAERAQQRAPASHSDIPGGAAPATRGVDKIDSMSPTQLEAAMEKLKSFDDINQFVTQHALQ